MLRVWINAGPNAAQPSLQATTRGLMGHQVVRLQTAGHKRLRQRAARAARRYDALLLERRRRHGGMVLGVVAGGVVARPVATRGVAALHVVARRVAVQ